MKLRRFAHARRGYTVVEVVMALAVLSVSIVGIVGMMKASVVGNLRSRNLSTGQAIAQAWVERLRADAMVWTEPQGFANTRWLNVVGNDYPTVGGQENVWFRPDAIPGFYVNPEADVRGVDVNSGEPSAFCVNLKLVQIQPNLIRAEVRVFWLAYQQSVKSSSLVGNNFCSGNQVYLDQVSRNYDQSTTNEMAGAFHTIYVATTVVRNDQL